jgi:hypothetical protein
MPNLLFWFLPLLVLAFTNAKCSHEDCNLTLFVLDFAQRTRSCLGRHTRSPYGLSKQVRFPHCICGRQNDIFNRIFCISQQSFADLGHIFIVRIKVQVIVHLLQNSRPKMLPLPPQILTKNGKETYLRRKQILLHQKHYRHLRDNYRSTFIFSTQHFASTNLNPQIIYIPPQILHFCLPIWRILWASISHFIKLFYIQQTQFMHLQPSMLLLFPKVILRHKVVA